MSILNSWPALKIAIDHGAGGQHRLEKAKWIIDAVDQWMQENDNVEDDELEDCLSQILCDEFDLCVQDGSLTEVSSSICRCFLLCRAGRDAEVESTYCSRTMAPVQVHVQEATSDASDDDAEAGDQEDMDTTSQNEISNATVETIAPQLTTSSDVNVDAATHLSNGVSSKEEEDDKEKMDDDDGEWKEVKRGRGGKRK